ncbi:MAG: phosphotransferase [Deltaproteobacteria bacterium]|nr:MAG: phosphotransferase [Deltaproteobacteria bacterium]
MDIKAVKHLGRFKNIIVTLFRYGFDDVVERLDLPGKILIEKIRKVDREMSTWERFRHMLDDLGPTYIKFGQIMSLRPDLIPNALILELRKLQDEVAPVGYDTIRNQVENSLQLPLTQVFSSFEEKPLAAASLAQVHRAVLRDSGQVVAVKVQRPKIRQMIETDLYILELIAGQLDDRMESVRIYDLPTLVQEVKKTLLRELDFTREARHIKICRGNLSETQEVYIPQVYERYSTDRILTMELVQGTKMKELAPDDQFDREILAKRGLRLTIKQVLEDGFFHADPHPGNVIILDDNVLCVLDWGMVGRLTRRARYELIDLINAVVDKDSERILTILVNLTQVDGSIIPRRMEREILDILDIYHSLPIQELNLGQLLLDISTMLRENRLKVPVDLAVMIKALITAEGTARQLYPELNVVKEAEPYVKRLALERWKPEVLWRDLRRNLSTLFTLQRELPLRLSQIVEKIDRGELNIRFQHANLGGLRSTLENISNRLTLGIIIAALIIASSMIITTGVKPLLFGFPALGIVGYMVSGVLGLWLVFNILRSRKF